MLTEHIPLPDVPNPLWIEIQFFRPLNAQWHWDVLTHDYLSTGGTTYAICYDPKEAIAICDELRTRVTIARALERAD
jgi:hypothetical protein